MTIVLRISALLSLVLAANPVLAQVADTANLASAMRDAKTACLNDAKALWGRSLCGPIAFVERQTRLVVTNDTVSKRLVIPYGDLFATTAPAGIGFANTSFDWDGRTWAMILLPLPVDRFDRMALVMHEVFHREQKALALVGNDLPNNQLDDLDGRRWFRLELNAWAAALDALALNGPDVRRHAENALLFRAQRRLLYPGADSLERALELQEGLAEYTGDKLAMQLTGANASRVANRIREFHATPSYVRSFAYATGPALGLLLDRFEPEWRRLFLQNRDLSQLLTTALRLQLPNDLARIAAARSAEYGAREIAREELARDSVRRPIVAAYRQNLVDGPTITLRQPAVSRNFDPRTLVGFDLRSTVYPTGTFSAEWGSLVVTEGGSLIANDLTWVTVSAAADALARAADGVVRGRGWVLTLKPEWELRANAARAGSFEVVKRAQPSAR